MFDFKFDWDDMLLTHLEDIDKQHKEFFSIGRTLDQYLLIGCTGVSNEQLMGILYQLRDFVTYHIYAEEPLLSKLSAPERIEHFKVHNHFKHYINGINYEQLCAYPIESITALRNVMIDFAFDDIIHCDQKLTKLSSSQQKK